MFRLGIIGTENSHAMAFSKIINLPNPDTGKLRHTDAKVVGVYGPDTVSANKIVAEAGVEFVASDPSEFFGKVDAMFITSRRGSVHYQYALPFVEKGMPVFVDKPFTVDIAESEALVAAAKKHGANLYGGSGTKLADEVLVMRDDVQKARAEGELLSACVSYRADPASEYDGFFFYSSHLVEICLTVFGYDMQSVIAVDRDGFRTAIARYKDCDVTLNFAKDAKEATGLIITKSRNIADRLCKVHSYPQEVEEFLNMLRTGRMPLSFEQLVMPVRVINAIERSVVSGKFEAV